MQLHHILGLIFLVPLTTYMLSGLLSMNPWGVFDDEVPFSARLAAYKGAPTVRENLTDEAFASPARNLALPPDTRELVWQWIGGSNYAYAVTGDGQRQLLTSLEQDCLEDSALAEIQRVMANHGTVAIERLADYDLYYYSHYKRWRPLPVLRVRFDDASATWYHIDLTTGELINQLTETGRARRWLYNGLHSLDFRFLIENRPA